MESHRRTEAGPAAASASPDALASSASPTRITVRPDQQPGGAPSSSPSALTVTQKAPRTWLSSYAARGRTSKTTGGPPCGQFLRDCSSLKKLGASINTSDGGAMIVAILRCE